MLGKMHLREAQDLARNEMLDLVQVSKQEGTSICKIMDHGKWLYEQKKKAKAKKNQKHLHQLKEMKFGMRIDPHDEGTKINHIRKFFEKGHDVRVVVEMRGRERAHPESAQTKLDEILSHFEYDLKANSQRKNPRHISVIVKPKKNTNERKHACKASKEVETTAAETDRRGEERKAGAAS